MRRRIAVSCMALFGSLALPLAGRPAEPAPDTAVVESFCVYGYGISSIAIIYETQLDVANIRLVDDELL